MRYPVSTTSFDALFTLSGRYAFSAWRQIFLFILLWVALMALLTHFPVFSIYFEMALGVVIAAAAIFLYTMSLYRVDGLLRETPLTLRQALEQALRRILKIYLACLWVVGGCGVIFLLGRWLIYSVLGLTGATAGVTIILLVGIPMIVLLIYCYLAIPLLALNAWPLWQAFYQSIAYTRQIFLPMIFLYVEMVLMLIIASTHTQHGQWLLRHHLMELTNLVVFSIILPLVINQTLLFLHKLQSQ